jgi:hypothetical protein
MNNPKPNQHDPDPALRQAVLEKATAINVKLQDRFQTVAEDLAAGEHLAAIGGLDGIECEINTMRSFLLLLR